MGPEQQSVFRGARGQHDLGLDSALNTLAADWSESSVLDTPVQSGADDASTRSSCPAVSGKIRVCNYDYGNTGWLGIAEIWLLRGRDGHITHGRTKMNEFYADMRSNADARLHVACQEVGHTLGLDHQRGTGDQTCMNDVYGRWDPAFNHPNGHDYDELVSIYSHLDGPKKGGPPGSGSKASDRSVQVREEGEHTVVTFIFWA